MATASANDRPVLALPPPDLAAIEKLLGTGVVGAAVPASALDEPATLLPLHSGARTYRILSGPRAGRSEQHRIVADAQATQRPAARDIGGGETVFFAVDRDGSVVIDGIEESQQSALTRYTPSEPLLPKGLRPGAEKQVTMRVKVYDADDIGEPNHEGTLQVRCRYVGAYRVTVPAGTVDAVLIKTVFSGQIGPARLDDTQYRFFAAKLGLVAAIEQRDVSAFYLYHAHTAVARVLVTADPGR